MRFRVNRLDSICYEGMIHCRMNHRAVSGALKLMMRPVLFLSLFLALPAISAEFTATQQPSDLTEMSLEELMELQFPKVYSASKFEQKTTEAPSSVSVLTSDDFKRYGYRTLADALQSLQGVNVSYDRNYSFLGMRGINLGDFNSRVLLLVDGHRLNNNLTDGGLIDTAFILDVDLIDRVEFIRGPGSVLYGNNAFFGVINVVTRRANQVDGAEFSGEYASFDTYKGRVTIGKSFTNGLEVMLSGTLYDSDGDDRIFFKEFDTPGQNNGVAKDMDKDEFGSFFGSVRYRDFTLEGGYINREKRNPTAQFFTTFNDPHLRTIDERSYVDLKYAHEFTEVVDVTARVYYDRNDFDIGYPLAGTVFREKDVGEWWGAELQLNKRLWDRHILTVGGEYRDDFRQNRRLFDAQTGQVFTDLHRDRHSYGIFVQGDFEVVTNLHLNAGVRYDQYGSFDPRADPRLALIYHPFSQSTLKFIYGTAFRDPNFLELSDPRFQNIEAEKISTYELIWEQGIGRNLRSSVSAFLNEMDDLIALLNGRFTNFDAEAKGIEVAFEGFWTNGIHGRASYTFQTTENTSRDLELPDSPEHLFKFNLSVPLLREKIFAGVEFQYISGRRSLPSTSEGQTVSGPGGFGIVNFTLFSHKILKNLEFSASVYNLLDRNYGDPASRFHEQDSLPRDGRTFRVKLVYRY
jgi:iron complex outermembrane receptor protein